MASVRLRTGVAAGLIGFVVSSLSGCVGVSGGHQRGVFNSDRSAPIAAVPPPPAPIDVVLVLDTTPAANLGTPDDGTSSCGTSGCTTCSHHGNPAQAEDIVTMLGGSPYRDSPNESDRVSLPPYKVAPHDILSIDLVRMAPRPLYRVQRLDTLMVTVTDTLPGEPITGPFVISPDGAINLGYSYGSVSVGDLTIDQVQDTVRTFLGRTLRNPQVTVSLAQFRGFHAIRGEHLIRPDGTVSLGVYGSVHVAGLSLGQTKGVIEKQLSEYFYNPEISVGVFAYNSRKIYVIIDGGHLGQQVFPLDATGSETVLDAISRVQGLAQVSSKKRIWVARPAPHMGSSQILPVNWRAITDAGLTATNYQLLPGDRVYVAAGPLMAFDNWLSNVLAPVERVLGVTFLATETFNGNNNNH